MNLLVHNSVAKTLSKNKSSKRTVKFDVKDKNTTNKNSDVNKNITNKNDYVKNKNVTKINDDLTNITSENLLVG